MPPGGKNRDPHYMNLRNGNMLSLHGKASKQYAEDDERFNPATMGNRIFKTLPKRAVKSPKGMTVGRTKNYANAARKRLRMGSASKGRYGYGRVPKVS